MGACKATSHATPPQDKELRVAREQDYDGPTMEILKMKIFPKMGVLKKNYNAVADLIDNFYTTNPNLGTIATLPAQYSNDQVPTKLGTRFYHH
jgi:hypothetical protein